MAERGRNKQLFINMLASLITFAVGTGVGLILTPFIVKNLGAEAYGFVGLSNTIISYAGIITIALNGMAGRFIALSYNRGEIEIANKYYSSVFYANLFLSLIISLAFVGCIIWLECMINIPSRLLWDVKLLFGFLALTNVMSLMTGVYGTATFIKNRLDLGSVRTIISQLIRTVVLVLCFGFLSAHVWYIGVSGVACSIYVFLTNIKLARKLTPELKINKKHYEWERIKELLTAGVWNLVTKIGDMLANGIDLLFANIFIGSVAMGVFAITKTIPIMVQGLMSNVSGVFGPVLLQIYAKDDTQGLVNELLKSVRIQAILSAIPLSVLYVFGEDFYHLWLPNQDAHWLFILTVAATSSMVLWQPLESLWQVFTLTNKVKIASIAIIINNGLTFLIAFLCMFIVESGDMRLLILAGTKNAIKFILTLTFLPLVTAKLIGASLKTFYPTMFRYTSCFILICFIGYVIKRFIKVDSWVIWISYSCALAFISIIINYLLVLKSSDRYYFDCLVKKYLKRTI